MADPRTVVLVGHCGPDMFMLKSAVKRVVGNAPIEDVNDERALAERLDDDHVLLVNRVLDGTFESDSGTELIRRVTADGTGPIAILISNFEDAQAEAVAAGARPGFGKKDLYATTTADTLRAAVDR